VTNPFDLTGKTAIVTGGAGILGRGFCRVLAENGARVALVDLDQSAAEAAVDEIVAAGVPQDRVVPVVCDVSDPASVARMVEAVTSRLGNIHILHNNAANKTCDLGAFFCQFV
jgi:NAD(P)-dependent dehydrogenase (short-subunit alcohol dehydrogenase family)